MAGYVLLCPGQGAQHPAMLDFALATPEGRAAIEEASSAAGLDIAARVRSGNDLFEPVFAQVCLVATELASWSALAPRVPAPGAVAGYSVGEVASWGCAGTWTIAQTMRLAQRRAMLMRDASPPDCSMLAVTGVSRAEIERARGCDVHVAIEVDTDHHILAGPAHGIGRAGEALAAAGATLRSLPVSVPSHTPLLASAAEALRELLASIDGRPPDFPVVRGMDGRALFARADATDALADAVRSTIRWRAVLREIAERGMAVALELPPGAGLTRMLVNAYDTQARAVADFRSVQGVATWLDRALAA